MPTVRLAEAVPLSEAATGTPAGRKFHARLIEGNVWGSCGYYSAEVLQEAAAARVFAEGTPIYLDHPGATEQYDRPERSVRDLAGKITTDAVYEADGLYADIEVYPHIAPVIEGMVADIGMSIRATAEVDQGEAGGRRGTIIKQFGEAISVDFVTKAGAGGKVVTILESARPLVNARAIAHGVAEATANDTREALQAALKDTYGGEDSWVWVRDFDGSTVWYEHETPDESGTYAEGYTLSAEGAVALAGDRTEVRVRTEYVPVTRPGSTTATTTEESEEDTMPEIAESELRTLREAAGRVQTLESELSTERQARESAETERDQLKESAAVTRRTDRAREIITARATEAGVEFNPREIKGFLADIKVTESGDLDEPALTKLVDDEAAAVKESQGAGRPRSLGRTTPPTPDAVSEADLDALDDAVFGKIQEA